VKAILVSFIELRLGSNKGEIGVTSGCNWLKERFLMDSKRQNLGKSGQRGFMGQTFSKVDVNPVTKPINKGVHHRI